MTMTSYRLVVGALAGALLVAPAAFAAGHGNAGGSSGAHMSSQGRANTNGPNAADRDFGRDRAEDRAQLKDNDERPDTTRRDGHRTGAPAPSR